MSGFQLELAYNLLQKKKRKKAINSSGQLLNIFRTDQETIHTYICFCSQGCLLLNLLVIMGLLPLSSNVETNSRHRQTIRFLISTARNCRQDSQATFQHNPFNIKVITLFFLFFLFVSAILGVSNTLLTHFPSVDTRRLCMRYLLEGCGFSAAANMTIWRSAKQNKKKKQKRIMDYYQDHHH